MVSGNTRVCRPPMASASSESRLLGRSPTTSLTFISRLNLSVVSQQLHLNTYLRPLGSITYFCKYDKNQKKNM